MSVAVLSLSTIVKFGSPLAGKSAGFLVSTGWKRWNSWHRRVAKKVTKSADFPIPRKELVKALKDPRTFDALSPADEASAQATVDIFDEYFSHSGEWSRSDTGLRQDRLIETVISVQHFLLRELDPSTAVHAMDSRAQSRHMDTKVAIDAVGASLEELRAQKTAVARFSEISPTLPPPFARFVETRGEASPPLLRLANLIAASSDIRADLMDLHRSPPSWVTDDPMSNTILGLGIALGCYGRPEAAIEEFELAVSRGVPDRAYWRAKAALFVLEDDAERARALVDHCGSHPLADVVLHWTEHRWNAAYASLHAWSPDGTDDCDLRSLLIAQLEWNMGHHDAAIAILDERITLSSSNATLRLQLARLLMTQAQLGEAIHRESTLQRAMDLALSARDQRRRWGGDSVEAITLAADIAIVTHYSAALWMIVRPEPDGNATTAEASDPRLIGKAGLAAAMRGQFDLARTLAASAPPFESAWINALTRELELGTETAELTECLAGLWREAWELATNDDERLIAARGILILDPQTSLEGFDELRNQAPQAVADIEAQIDVLGARPNESAASRKMRLKRMSLNNALAATALSNILTDDGDIDEAARTLTDAADRFGDQHLRLRAVMVLAQNGQLERAAQEAKLALTRTSERWPGRRAAHEVILQSAMEQGDWPTATTHARQLHDLADGNPHYLWELITVLQADEKFEEAWRIVTSRADTLEFKDERQAALLIELTKRCGTQQQLFQVCLAALRKFGTNEQFAAFTLASVYRSDTATSARASAGPDANCDDLDDDAMGHITEDELRELHEHTRTFIDRFPDSKYFRSIQLSDTEDPAKILAQITPFLKDSASDEREAVAREVRGGRLPAGVLSMTYGRTYTEILVRRAAGSLQLASGDPDELWRDRDALTGYLNTKPSLVIDISFLNTADLLSPNTRDAVLAFVSRQSLISAASIKDLRSARDTFAMRSTMSMSYDNATEGAIVHEIDQSDADMLADRSQRLVKMSLLFHRIDNHGSLRRDPATSSLENQPWLNAIRECQDRRGTLCSDDAALRRLARSEGVPAFGTLAILTELASSGEITESDYREALTTLVRNYAMGIPFEMEVLRTAAISDSWEPRGAAFTLSDPAQWAVNTAGCLTLLEEAVHRTSSKPDLFAGWVQLATRGIVGVTQGSSTFSGILPELIADLATRSNFSSAGTKALLDGVRSARQEYDFPDPWPAGARLIHQQLLETYDEDRAARILLDAISQLVDQDRLAAVQVLTDSRR
ncbi:hypothetical protein [Rhodococcus jostii]|uniref:hypothetical protein n=1 Tax=Rhodococcus jostii TaxID=132919 RepID=UPI0036575ED1